MMGWARETRFPGEPFNQCASLPLTMTLRAIGGRDVLCFYPVPEIETLRGKPLINLTKAPAEQAVSRLRTLVKEDALDVVLRLRAAADARPLKFSVRSLSFDYDPASGLLRYGDKQETHLHPGESLTARFVIDRGLVECFWNDGEAAYAVASLHTDAGPAFALEAPAGTTIEELTVYPMKPARFH